MRILVTGSLGAVGAPLTAELRRRGHGVSECDVRHASSPAYHRCDVGEYRQISDALRAVKPELVYHLGAEFGRWNGEHYYEQVWRSNAIGTKNLIRLQEELGFRMVFSSSSEVYGDWPGLMSEDVMMREPIRQLNDYAISKWVNEQQIMNSADRHGTETVRVRLFNTYGPGEYYSPYRSVICRFVYSALHDLPYEVFLDHHRTSSYVDDTVRTLANISDEGRFRAGAVYNISGDDYHDIKSLSDLILAHLGKNDELVTYTEHEEHNTKDKKADNSQAVSDLDHKATVPLAVGIERTIEWQREVYEVA